MGQTLKIISNIGLNMNKGQQNQNPHKSDKLPDLASWPPELSLNVLKNLNATELCLAACVWQELGRDDTLWQSLCQAEWPHLAIYDRKNKPNDFNYRSLYLKLDEATVTFNADYSLGIDYFLKNKLLEDHPDEIAKLIFYCKRLDRTQVRSYLLSDEDVVEPLIKLFDFTGKLLPDALRDFFTLLEVTNKYDHYLHLMVEKFAWRYVQCNPPDETGATSINRHSSETIYVLSFSLMLLSADLFNPHVKNKMSKREFIRNVRSALRLSDDDFYGYLYDDVYLRGHIATGNNDTAAPKPSQAYGLKPPMNAGLFPRPTNPSSSPNQYFDFFIRDPNHYNRFHIIH